nr:hypothetical protein [Chlamydiota bacterium]
MQRSPVLFWALFFLIGCGFVLHPHWVYVVPALALLFLTKRKVQGLVFLAVGVAYTLVRCPSVDLQEMEGRGVFQLERIQPIASPFQRSFALKGKLLCFESNKKYFHNVPCMILQKKIPKTGTRWILEGKFICGMLKLKKGTTWQEVQAPFSLARWRFQNKERIRGYFHKKITDKRTGHFFASIATGDIDDRLLAMEFRKIGLGHILAISGFHFALIAAMLGGLFNLFMPQRWAYGILLGCLGGYYLFLGFSPSVLRAFLMIVLFVLGRLLHRRIDVCNLLGAALLIELALDPQVAMQVGFCLSFLATLGILVFYRPMHQMLEKLLRVRSFSEVKKMGRIDQHGYLLTSAIRKGAALNLSVHLVTLPVVLYVFHSFPMLSLAYNLVIPPFLGISMLLIPLGVLLPPLGALNAKFTAFLLQMIANPPELLHYQIFVGNMPYWLLISTVTLIGLFGL